jgi:hypothetical protein
MLCSVGRQPSFAHSAWRTWRRRVHAQSGGSHAWTNLACVARRPWRRLDGRRRAVHSRPPSGRGEARNDQSSAIRPGREPGLLDYRWPSCCAGRLGESRLVDLLHRPQSSVRLGYGGSLDRRREHGSGLLGLAALDVPFELQRRDPAPGLSPHLDSAAANCASGPATRSAGRRAWQCRRTAAAASGAGRRDRSGDGRARHRRERERGGRDVARPQPARALRV